VFDPLFFSNKKKTNKNGKGRQRERKATGKEGNGKERNKNKARPYSVASVTYARPDPRSLSQAMRTRSTAPRTIVNIINRPAL